MGGKSLINVNEYDFLLLSKSFINRRIGKARVHWMYARETPS